jgi:hypothetical protein
MKPERVPHAKYHINTPRPTPTTGAREGRRVGRLFSRPANRVLFVTRRRPDVALVRIG